MARIDKEELARSVDRFRTEVDITLSAVRDQLIQGDYQTAMMNFNDLTQRVAKTNLAVRSVLIQGGHLDTK